jgi:cell fate regulator YaaT (PSP1 superfamily)
MGGLKEFFQIPLYSICFFFPIRYTVDMKTISAIDWLIHKPVNITLTEEQLPSTVQAGDFLLYKDDEWKEHLAEYCGYTLPDNKTSAFVKRLSARDMEQFHTNQQMADEHFVLFSEAFTSSFPDAKTICARSTLRWDHLYFYFYAEERYNFSDFVRSFRENIQKKFFIYQVSSRDRVKLHPDRHNWFDTSWLPLMYTIFRHPLPMVEHESLQVQQLDGRDPERLKDRSGKYNYTFAFEKEFYEEEMKQYPQRWTIVYYEWNKTKCMWYNLLTQEIKLRWQGDSTDWFTWEWIILSLDEYKKNCTLQAPKKPV